MMGMVRKLAVVTLLLVILCSMMVGRTSAQTREPGVSEGDTFTYDVTSFWKISNINATVPLYLLDINQTESFRVTISEIMGAMVTTEDTWVFKNGTERNSTGMVNVETGFNFGGFWPIVGANLGKDDLLHPSGQNGITVNETITWEYPSGAREINHFTLNYQGTDEEFGYFTAEADYYFDRATGILVELQDKSSFLTAGTQGAIMWKIKESNVWTVPEFPSALIIPLFMIVTLLAVIAYKKKRTSSTQRQVPAKTLRF
jgi:hypothetical protein